MNRSLLEGGCVRHYVGERRDGAPPAVWVVERPERPEVGEIVVALAELRRLTDDGPGDPGYEARREEWLQRKEGLLNRIRVAEYVRPAAPLSGAGSTEEFDWGHRGRGTGELAHVLLARELGVEPNAAVQLAFRNDVVASLPTAGFDLRSSEIWTWITRNRELVDRELFLNSHDPPSAPEWSTTTVERPRSDRAESQSAGEATASALVAACEAAWSDIQRHHHDLPDAVIVLGTGIERGRLVKLGHWWGGRWIADGRARGEVLLAGEALHLEPKQVFEVLLHEAAHGINAARGVKDTSRGGRYHNQRFAVTAQQMLLRIRAMPPYGLANTSLTPDAEERYAGTIDRLGEAMRIARQLERGVEVGGKDRDGIEGTLASGNGDTGRRRSNTVAVCGCGRRLRMAPSVLAAGPVLCGLCGSEFATGVERNPDGPEPAGDAESHGHPVVDTTFLARRQALLGAARPPSNNEPLRDRLDRLATLLADAIEQPVGPTRDGLDDRRALEEWYGRFGTMHEQPMPARSPDEARRRERLARTLLKADGTLRGPAVTIPAGEIVAGDRVNVDFAEPLHGVPPGTLGTVERVDPARGTVDIDFATWGRLRTNIGSQLAQGLRLDYTQLDAGQGPNDGPDRTVELGRIDTGVEV
jgi:hypothetical protein